MKVIVDTCVWSLALRRRDLSRIGADEQQFIEQLKEAIQEHRVAMIGPIRQEILSGIRDQGQFARILELLEPFRDAGILFSDYVEAARLFHLCRDRGVECGPVDSLLCAVAARSHSSILTYDQGLLRCVSILRAEGLIR